MNCIRVMFFLRIIIDSVISLSAITMLQYGLECKW